MAERIHRAKPRYFASFDVGPYPPTQVYRHERVEVNLCLKTDFIGFLCFR